MSLTKEFSKLDQAKLDLIRLKNKLEDLRDMTLRDYEEIDYLEKSIGTKHIWILELQAKHDAKPVEVMRRDMESHKDNVIDLKELK